MARAKKTEPVKQDKKQSAPKLVKMKTVDGKEADVHPDMVENYQRGGYHKV